MLCYLEFKFPLRSLRNQSRGGIKVLNFLRWGYFHSCVLFLCQQIWRWPDWSMKTCSSALEIFCLSSGRMLLGIRVGAVWLKSSFSQLEQMLDIRKRTTLGTSGRLWKCRVVPVLPRVWSADQRQQGPMSRLAIWDALCNSSLLPSPKFIDAVIKWLHMPVHSFWECTF